MARDPGEDRRLLTAPRLKAVLEVTRALAEAVLTGDLDRAAVLLEQRQLALKRLDLKTGEGELEAEVRALKELEHEILDFCRTWREVLKERLEMLGTCHLLRRRYESPGRERQFVDVHK